MKLKYKLSRLAFKDLSKIWSFTAENWSKSQANLYYKGILKQIDLVCSNPEIGKSIDEVKTGSRIVFYKSHIIIYKNNNEVILIDRILHQRMNIEDIVQ